MKIVGCDRQWQGTRTRLWKAEVRTHAHDNRKLKMTDGISTKSACRGIEVRIERHAHFMACFQEALRPRGDVREVAGCRKRFPCRESDAHEG